MRFFTSLTLLAAFASASILPTIQNILTPNTPITALNAWSYTNCGTTSDAITISSITLSPDPPLAGSPLTATIAFTANKQVLDGAYIDISVSLGFIKLLSTTVDLCEEEGVLKDTGVSCPVEVGEHTLVKEVELPAEIPPASFTVEAVGHTVDDGDMFCVELVADFRSAAAAMGKDGL